MIRIAGKSGWKQHVIPWTLALAAAWALAGCASGPERTPFRDPVMSEPAPDGVADLAKIKTPRPRSITLTLGGAVYLALSRNPRLAALRKDVHRRTGLILKADKAPNPRVTVSPQAPLQGGLHVNWSVEVSQLLELGKSAARVRTASSGRDVARAIYAMGRNQLLLKVRQTVIEIAAYEVEARLIDDLIEDLDRLYKLEVDRVKEGRLGEKAEIMAGIRLEKGRLRHLTVERQQRDARRALEDLCDLTPEALLTVEFKLPETRFLPPEARLQRTAVKGNPYLVSIDRKTALARDRLEAAKIRPVPDVRVGVKYMRDEVARMDTIGLSLSIPVPIWDQNKGNVTAFQHALEALREDRKAGENEILLKLSMQVNLHREVLGKQTEYGLSILPALEKALALSVLERQAGRASLLEVFDARVRLIEGKLDVLGFRRKALLARARIESLMGELLG
jgi:cobalt-zinc-cadmium efflux system outer membrane protein